MMVEKNIANFCALVFYFGINEVSDDAQRGNCNLYVKCFTLHTLLKGTQIPFGMDDKSR